MTTAGNTKDTVYVDVDDEITAIIDKVVSSPRKIVALVLPKRAATLQSIVNMKLLKRTADDAKKRVVLITSEAGLLPLAGAVGLHVAKSLQSRPAIPPAPNLSDAAEAVDAEPVFSGPQEPELDPEAPVGELAGLPLAEDDEPIEVDNRDKDAMAAAAAASTAVPKDKKLKVPNFERFRTRLFLGIGALFLLIGLWFIAGNVLPKARIVIKTDTAAITSNLDFTATKAVKEYDAEKKLLPAELKEVKKTDAEKVPATGQKDLGTKATGKVTLTNCSKDDGTVTVPAGTGVSANNLTFITTEAATIPPSNFSGGGACKNDSSRDVAVVAQSAGDQYNLSARNYTVAGFGAVNGYGTAMTGGTSKIVKVVSDQDIENARQKIAGRQSTNAIDEVRQELKQTGLFGISETFTSAPPTVTASPTLGQEATEVTVTSIVTHSMLGVKEADLKRMLEEDVTKQIDTAKQEIQRNDLDKAVFRLLEKRSPTDVRLSVQSITTVGPRLDLDSLKREIAGKKRGDTLGAIEGRPGVRDVTVEYTPFWVYATPKKTGKITIVLEQANGGQ